MTGYLFNNAAAGVSFEDRQDLLGHKSGRITTHYSAAEINNLIAAANKVCRQNNESVPLTLLTSSKIGISGRRSRKSHDMGVRTKGDVTD